MKPITIDIHRWIAQAEDYQGIVQALGFESELDRVRAVLGNWIDNADQEMRDALCWQFMDRSKYFRPLTVFTCYRALNDGRIPDQIVLSAAVVEMFHNMSLIVDDILDRSRYRRGKQTLHCRFGNLTALMASGYIVADGYRLLIDDPEAIELCSELMKRLGVAECLQWRLRQTPLGVEDWRRIASEDTGSMFEVCACLGARGEKLRRFGHLLGVLYHGCDDVADVRGLEGLGGGGNDDIRDGILTLPAAISIRDPKVAAMFRNPTKDNQLAMAGAFKRNLPEAESYLDQIADEAKAEARLFAQNIAQLDTLVEHTRGLTKH